MADTDKPTILIVEDEPAVVESFEMMLTDGYDIGKAYGGDEALEKIDDEVDVVLLDRMMPGTPGEEVLEEIRERGFDCRVAMVTAVAPDFDIIEMGFDAYVTKPPTEEKLQETVENLVDRSSYDESVREYYSLFSKRAALKEEMSEEELSESEEYAELEDRIEELSRELEVSTDRLLDDAEFVGSLRNLTGDGSKEANR